MNVTSEQALESWQSEMPQSCSRSLFPELQAHMTEWSGCTKCALSQCRTNSVYYRGSLPATLLFIGDSPDPSSSSTALPFWGPTADVLDAYVPKALRGDWAVTYAAICGPSSATLSTTEVDACWHRLVSFIVIAQPKIICTLGKIADSVYLRHMGEVITKLNRRPLCIRVNSPIYSLGAKDRVYEENKARLHIEASLEKLK